MADFAPYQDIAPETERAKSPPPRITSPKPAGTSNGTRSPPPRVQSPSFQRDTGDGSGDGNYHAPGAGWGGDAERQEGRGAQMDVFQTRLGLRMDVEACLAYLVLPPVGGVVLLILEHRSDYVRYVQLEIGNPGEGIGSKC